MTKLNIQEKTAESQELKVRKVYKDSSERVTSPSLHQVFILNKYKQCTGCGKYKPFSSFYESSGRLSPDSHEPRCKRCLRVRRYDKNAKIEYSPQKQLYGFKKCSKCGNFYTFDSFYVDNAMLKLKLCSNCKQCIYEQQKERNNTIEMQERKKAKAFLLLNPPDFKICTKCSKKKPLYDFPKSKIHYLGVHSQCKLCKTKQQTSWRIKNRDHVNANCRKYNREHPEKRKAIYQRNIAKDPDYRKEYCREWRRKNADRVNEQQRNRKKNNPKLRLNANFSTVIGRSLKRKKECSSKWDILPYTLEELMQHLESKFTEGMDWDGYGPIWHLDHKIPLSVFNFKTIHDIDFKKAWALDNLQPLFARDNLKKGNKLEAQFQPSFAFGGKLK